MERTTAYGSVTINEYCESTEREETLSRRIVPCVCGNRRNNSNGESEILREVEVEIAVTVKIIFSFSIRLQIDAIRNICFLLLHAVYIAFPSLFLPSIERTHLFFVKEL